MTIQTINIGNSANDGNGEPARSAFNKINQNFTNYSHSASRLVGTQSGNVMEVGAFGVGKSIRLGSQKLLTLRGNGNAFYWQNNGNNVSSAGDYPDNSSQAIINLDINDSNDACAQLSITHDSDFYVRSVNWNVNTFQPWRKILSSKNTTVDANGFIKSASPVVKLFADKIEPNDEAAEQNITFEKLDVGHYLLKGTSGFATEGWYIETPKDANGNILFAVIYQQLENKDIEIKTFKKKFDVESASIIADLDNPVDISTGRWIDIRLQEIPKPVPEMPVVTENDPE
ncbi:pyocin knob domain-containing protein [Acinetobacter ursingii]|uniref:pyocin knob domain-containing protein n=1 Tax=Acinetobacter ursingii TaxID=108980 RepID=UPI0021E325DB|nr:pyocin knob domain-containing protein [Acinetobacter ursingii]UYF78234.1 pyocin knob domain-containing protein [Acinetobacter ursingii]